MITRPGSLRVVPDRSAGSLTDVKGGFCGGEVLDWHSPTGAPPPTPDSRCASGTQRFELRCALLKGFLFP